MKKLMKSLVAIFLTLGLLVACGGDSKTDDAAVKMGVASTQKVFETRDEAEDKVEFNIVAVGVALQDDKVAYISIDESQQFAEGNGEVAEITAIPTKKDRGSDYGMLGASEAAGLGKEWDDQIKGVEEDLIGKTLDEVKAYFGGEEVLSSATIILDDIEATVVKAIESAKEVSGVAKVGFGHRVSVESKQDGAMPESVLEYAMVAFDADGNIIEALLDNAQEKAGYEAGEWDTTGVNKTKDELQGDYNMIGASPIGKEWFEQNDAFMEFVKGKSVEDVVSIGDPTENDDLKSSVTMHIDGPQAAIKSASDNAQDLK